MKKSKIEFILLACCTCKRPKMLKRTIDSVNEIDLPENTRVEFLIVDNDPEQTAQNLVLEQCKNSKIKIHYVCEPKRGLSNARNKILKEAVDLSASHIFMFDDDETLTKNALMEHIKLYEKDERCHISSGNVLAKFAPSTPKYIIKNIAFKWRTNKKTGEIKTISATGNVFFPVAMIKEQNLKFSSEYVFMGGEDGDFFKRASLYGYTIIQNSNSILYEEIDSTRANLKFMFKKVYYNGYSSSFLKFKKNTLKKKNPFFYIFKLHIVLLLNLFLLLPSILLGRVVFFNVLSMIIKTYGKINGAIKREPINFYKTIYGE